MRRVCVGLLSAAVAVLLAQSGWADPRISFKDATVVAEDVTPGGRVACYGVGREFVEIHPELLRWGREVVDDDGDGVVAIELPRAVPRRSLWVCADVTAGLLAVASPINEFPQAAPFVGSGVKVRGALASFGVDGAQQDLFLFRPRDGAWLALAGDGGVNDSDQVADGRVITAVDTFRGIGGVRAVPASLHAGGIIVAIDPLSLQFSIVPVGKQ